MPTKAHKRDIVQQGFALTRPEDDTLIWSHNPLPISLVQVDWRIKMLWPFHHCRIKMRVRDGNGLEATSLLDGCHRLFIEQADTIPENISLGSLYKQCPLPYGKSRLSADTCQVGFMLLESVMKTVLLHGGKSCPLLPIKPNILALIATNGTVLGWRCALSKLSSACCTNPVVHVASLLYIFSSR